MIEELVNEPMTDRYGNTYGQYPISNYEMVQKINEIIRYLNEKEKQK